MSWNSFANCRRGYAFGISDFQFFATFANINIFYCCALMIEVTYIHSSKPTGRDNAKGG